MKRKTKFKNGLVEQIKQEEKEELLQEELKGKYNIEEDVVVVEKSNMIKFFTKTLAGFVRVMAGILLYLLAIVGLAALLFPESRSVLWEQALIVFRDILRMI